VRSQRRMGETEFCEASDYSDFLPNEQILAENGTPLLQMRGAKHERL